MTPKQRLSQVLGQLDTAIAKAEADLQTLRVRLATLREIRATTAASGTTSPDASAGTSNGALGPSKAVRKYVVENPGLDIEAVIAALREHVKTKAKNRDRLIRNTVANMVRDGLLRRNENGGLVLNEVATAHRT